VRCLSSSLAPCRRSTLQARFEQRAAARAAQQSVGVRRREGNRTTPVRPARERAVRRKEDPVAPAVQRTGGERFSEVARRHADSGSKHASGRNKPPPVVRCVHRRTRHARRHRPGVQQNAQVVARRHAARQQQPGRRRRARQQAHRRRTPAGGQKPPAAMYSGAPNGTSSRTCRSPCAVTFRCRSPVSGRKRSAHKARGEEEEYRRVNMQSRTGRKERRYTSTTAQRRTREPPLRRGRC